MHKLCFERPWFRGVCMCACVCVGGQTVLFMEQTLGRSGPTICRWDTLGGGWNIQRNVLSLLNQWTSFVRLVLRFCKKSVACACLCVLFYPWKLWKYILALDQLRLWTLKSAVPGLIKSYTLSKTPRPIIFFKASSISKINPVSIIPVWSMKSPSAFTLCHSQLYDSVFCLLLSKSDRLICSKGDPDKWEPDVVMSARVCALRGCGARAGVRLVGNLNTAHGSSGWRSIKVCNQCSNRCSRPWMALRSLLQTHASKFLHLLENERKTGVRHWLLRVSW